MAATIQMGTVTAVADGYVWFTDDARAQEMLDRLLEPEGPSGADPNPDYHLALKAVERFGAELVRFDETEYVDRRVY